MPKYKIGNMWTRLEKPHNEIFLITTNNVLKRSKELVMGAGVAKQATLYFPGIAYLMGEKIINLPDDYYFLMLDEVKQWNDNYNQHILVGAIQTKRHYKDKSDLSLVRKSICKLNEYAKTVNNNINCPMPGVGLGGLQAEIVKKITDKSPDNIVYWTYS